MSSTFIGNLALSIFGQSHSAAIGTTLDGIPAGEPIDMDLLGKFLRRRSPGSFPWATTRKEYDVPEVLCGIVNGKTCGAPITAIIRNKDTKSSDYDNIRDIPRPSHADFTANVKYKGFQDVSGGGHFSGRLTAALCLAGGICLQILARRGIYIGAHVGSVGHYQDQSFDPMAVDKSIFSALHDMSFPTINREAAEDMIGSIQDAKINGDSVGGSVECAAIGLPPGLGDPIFDGMENRISRLIFAIPAVKGIEFGLGFSAASMLGSYHNDPFCISKDSIATSQNNHGGILGGITSGMPLIFRVAIKPTPSISKPQQSVSLSKMESAALSIRGRHDPCIVPRAVPCVESAAAIAILDAILQPCNLEK